MPGARANLLPEAGFPLGEFVRANRKKSNLIGWRQTLTSSPANHIRFLLVRANKFAKWKTGLKQLPKRDGTFCEKGGNGKRGDLKRGTPFRTMHF